MTVWSMFRFSWIKKPKPIACYYITLLRSHRKKFMLEQSMQGNIVKKPDNYFKFRRSFAQELKILLCFWLGWLDIWEIKQFWILILKNENCLEQNCIACVLMSGGQCIGYQWNLRLHSFWPLSRQYEAVSKGNWKVLGSQATCNKKGCTTLKLPTKD